PTHRFARIAAAAPDLPIDLLASPPPPPRHPTLARPLVLRAAPSSTAEELLPRLQPRRRRLVHCLGVGEEATLQFWSRPAVLLPPPATPVQIDTLVLPRLQATAGEKMEGTRGESELPAYEQSRVRLVADMNWLKNLAMTHREMTYLSEHIHIKLEFLPHKQTLINNLKKQLNRQQHLQWKFNFVNKMNRFLLY
uniref:Uncharacterized protein n=4 Tax=Aegilops tauschii subsp. strangulata TaxID=200361 RepID=A0A453J3W1_AEGTS